MLQRQLSLPRADWSARSGIVPSLDGLRGVSVAIVLIGHLLLPLSLVGISALGLKIFFFISGFLITRLLLAENKANGNISLPDFYIRRLLRLYPVIIVYITLVVAVMLARNQMVKPIDVASVFFYFVNYLTVYYDKLGQSMGLPVGMLWSLSVEEHFYLLAPLALVFVRGDARKMLAVALAICVASLSLRIIYAHFDPGIVNTLELYWRSETRFDCIAFGVVLACLTELQVGRRLIEWLSTRWAFCAGVAMLLISFAIRDNYFQNTWRFSMQGLALVPIVVGLVFAQPFPILSRVLNSRALIWLGSISYSLYVWHGGVTFLFPWLPASLSPPLLACAELGLSFALACLSFYVVERPILRLRKRLMPHGGKKQAEAAMAKA
ncbi:MAG: acyltransferase [Rhizobium sp.]|nr:acyltransferase [Rhizobium sp.]